MHVGHFALISGVIYLAVGILGFIPGALQPPGAGAPPLVVDQSYGRLFGLFPVNIVHNVVHLAIGVWGVLTWRRFAAARTYATSLAVIYGLLTVFGLIPGLNTLFGLAPLFGHDVWLHALTAAVAAYFAVTARRGEVARDRYQRAA